MATIISFTPVGRLQRPCRTVEPIVGDDLDLLKLLDRLHADILADACAVAVAINWPELATMDVEQASQELVALVDRPEVIAALEASHRRRKSF